MKVTSLFAVLFVAGLVSSCATFEGDDRHLQPIPARLVSEMQSKNMSPSGPILVRIYKRESELEVWKRASNGRYELLKTYPMCRWSGKLGPKRREGDRQAPEGFYTVTPGLMNPRSQYYLSFNLGYPNALERALGYEGSALMVHGACTSSGCFALTDDGVAEIYAVAREAFRGGQPAFQVQALPFRMTAQNLALYRDDPNMAFWRNLKEGTDIFDVTRQPPAVSACGGKYRFSTSPEQTALDPMAPCPPSDELPLVAQKRISDDARITGIADASIPRPAAYLDGGMHPSYRKILNDRGPAYLASLTSNGVEVSRPDAAASDPFIQGTGQ